MANSTTIFAKKIGRMDGGKSANIRQMKWCASDLVEIGDSHLIRILNKLSAVKDITRNKKYEADWHSYLSRRIEGDDGNGGLFFRNIDSESCAKSQNLYSFRIR